MGKTSNSGLGANSNSVDSKIEELNITITPFDSSFLSFEESEQKYDGYLLNTNHEIGKSKAKFLRETLGYNKGDGKKLHAAISEAISGRRPDKVTKTQYGIKATFNTKIKGNNGEYHFANISIVVQRDTGKVNWRLITITPRKKDE